MGTSLKQHGVCQVSRESHGTTMGTPSKHTEAQCNFRSPTEVSGRSHRASIDFQVPHGFFGTTMELSSQIHGAPKGLLRDFGVPTGLRWCFHGASWRFRRVPMGRMWDFHGTSVGRPWDFGGTSVVLPLGLMVFPWGIRGTFMGLAWIFRGLHRSHRTPVMLPWAIQMFYHGESVVFSW